MNPKPNLTCVKCGSKDYRTEQTNIHVKAVCNNCDSYIKFIPQGADENAIFPYGMHKGKPLKEIPPDYLLYMYDNNKVSGSIKQWIKENKPALVQRAHEAR